MRYSIAQHTLDLFDDTDMSLSCHEEDGASLADDDEETFRNEHAAQPVQEVTNATLKYYRKETKEVHAVHEQALAQEMAQLSFEDKHRIMFDIHGMPAVADSTPYSMGGTEIEMKEDVFLKQMEAILVDDQQILQLQTDYWTKVGRVPLHPKIVEEKRIQNEAEGSEKAEAILQAYREAEQTNPQYVRNTQLRLMFLKFRMQYKTYEHDELLYAKMAAMQLAYHFYVKKKLFGGGAILGRDVHLSDFNTDDRKGTVLKTCYLSHTSKSITPVSNIFCILYFSPLYCVYLSIVPHCIPFLVLFCFFASNWIGRDSNYAN